MINIYTHPLFYKHDTGISHPETAARLDAALEGVRRAGFDDRIAPEPCFFVGAAGSHVIHVRVDSHDGRAFGPYSFQWRWF